MTFWVLLLLFTALPALEIMAFLRIGSVLGLPTTLAVVLLTGIVGAGLARSQGFRVLQEIHDALQAGRMPTDELLQGAIVLVGGALLLTPGFLTDAFGLSCLFPVTRHAMAWWVKRIAKQNLQRDGASGLQVMGWTLRTGPVMPGPESKASSPFEGGQAANQSPGTPETIDASFTVVDGDEDLP